MFGSRDSFNAIIWRANPGSALRRNWPAAGEMWQKDDLASSEIPVRILAV